MVHAWEVADAQRVMPPDGVRPPEAPAPPADSPVLSFLRRVHDRHRLDDTGTVASYIPELAGADPAAFGIVVATVDGAVYEIGDTRTPFTIQSMAKPLTYAAILDRLGPIAVRQRIGVEPTGDAFNAISLGAGTGMPLNPMVNAGAITAVGLMPDGAGLAAWTRSSPRSAGSRAATWTWTRPSTPRNATPAIATGRSRTSSAAPARSPTTRTRSSMPTSRSAPSRSRPATSRSSPSTLANGGRHPLTGEQAASDATVRDTLSVMATCGMYDGAGEWMYEVGLPAKSGVSGGIFAVLPGQLGIGVWSPRLDSRGNSVRGVAVCRDLARELDLHLVRGARPPSAVRTRASVAALPSKRARGAHERERISVDGDRSLVVELQGSLGFVAVETLAREALPADGAADAVVVDLRRVQRIDPSVAGLLADLVAALGARGAAVAWSGANPHGEALSRVDDALAELRMSPPRRFAELDLALEWAEDVVLARYKGAAKPTRPARVHVPLEEHPVFAGLSGPVVDCLRRVMERRQFRSGDALVRHGEPAEELFVDHRRAAVGVGAGRRPGHPAAGDARGRAARRRARVPRPRAPHRRRLLRLRGRGLRAHDPGVRRARRQRPRHHDGVPGDAPADGLRHRPRMTAEVAHLAS